MTDWQLPAPPFSWRADGTTNLTPENLNAAMGYPGTVAESLYSFLKAQRNAFFATDYGIKADGGLVTNVAITSGTNVATSATAAWKAGQMIVIIGAGVSGAHFYGTISSVNPVTNAATLSANASTTVSGAEASYATDNFSNWQAMEAQLPAGATIIHPWGDMGFSDTPTSSKPLTLLGQGVVELYGGTTSFNDSNWPSVAPYLAGSVFVQFGAGKDGFLGSVVGRSQNWADMGIRFAGHYNNTGHGINLNPASTNVVGNTGGQVNRLKVFGTDGNHYGINAVAFLAMHFDNPRCYGGGGVRLYNGTLAFGQPGNSVFINPYTATYIGGSAHAFEVDSSGAASTWTSCTFINPQFSIDTQNPAIPGTSNPTNAQQCYHITGSVSSITMFRYANPGGQSQVTGSNATFPSGWGCGRDSDPLGIPVANATMTGGPSSGTGYQNLTGRDQWVKQAFELTPLGAGTNATTLSVGAAAGAASITPVSVTGLAAGQVLQIGDASHDSGLLDYVIIDHITGGTVFLLAAGNWGLDFAHSAGATVQVGAARAYAQVANVSTFPASRYAQASAKIGDGQRHAALEFKVPAGYWYRLDWGNAQRVWTSYEGA